MPSLTRTTCTTPSAAAALAVEGAVLSFSRRPRARCRSLRPLLLPSPPPSLADGDAGDKAVLLALRAARQLRSNTDVRASRARWEVLHEQLAADAAPRRLLEVRAYGAKGEIAEAAARHRTSAIHTSTSSGETACPCGNLYVATCYGCEGTICSDCLRSTCNCSSGHTPYPHTCCNGHDTGPMDSTPASTAFDAEGEYCVECSCNEYVTDSVDEDATKSSVEASPSPPQA